MARHITSLVTGGQFSLSNLVPSYIIFQTLNKDSLLPFTYKQTVKSRDKTAFWMPNHKLM